MNIAKCSLLTWIVKLSKYTTSDVEKQLYEGPIAIHSLRTCITSAREVCY